MVILCRSAKGVPVYANYQYHNNGLFTSERQLFPNYVYNDLILLFFEVDSFYQTLIVM